MRLLAWAVLIATTAAAGHGAPPLPEGKRALVEAIREAHGLTRDQTNAVAEIFARSPSLSQGNPAVTRHPMTKEECRRRRADAASPAPAPGKGPCPSPLEAPLYDPKSQAASDARACIDRYEFPGIPCEYPVVWARAQEAAQLCQAMGKRLCDAHEWEGACEGRLLPPDYLFELFPDRPDAEKVRRRREARNRATAPSWAYGPAYRKGVCAGGSEKSPGCSGGSWAGCGSNTYPAGSFPACVSQLGVYDLHGNAAEHMNLPLHPSEMASTTGRALGVTEMKGSWFIWDSYAAHQDWCRWRAPFWHGSRVMDPKSHQNYHLGFRCCRSLP